MRAAAARRWPGRSTSATRTRCRSPSWPRWSASLAGLGAATSCTSRGPRTTRRSAARTSPWPAPTLGWEPQVDARRRPAPHDRLVPGAARRPARRPRVGMTASDDPGAADAGGRRHRRGPGRAHRGARARPARRRRPPCSRPTGSSAGSAAPSSATAGASTSAATASSPRWRACAAFWDEVLPDGRVPAAAPAQPHPVPGPVLRLPAAPARTRCATSARSRRPLRRVVRVGPGPPARRPEPPRGLGRRPLRRRGSTGTSSRATTRRSGASRPPRSGPTGPRSGSRTCRWAGAVLAALPAGGAAGR